METGYIVASDIGGSGTKTGVFDMRGVPLAMSFRESRLYHPEPDATIQDSDEILAASIESIRECIAISNVSADKIEAIVLDGQQAGLIWIDEDYKAISPFDSWLDVRYAPYARILNDRCGEMLFQKAGTNNVTLGPKILWWKANRYEVFEKACKMVLPAAYVGGRLAGLRGPDAYFEDTSLCYSGICDIRRAKWDEEICQTVGIPMSKLPRIVKPTEIVGHLSKEGSRLLGLPSGIPIVAGAGDFPAAGIGAGISRARLAGDIAGTASLFFGCVREWEPDPTGVLRFTRSPIEGLWYAFAFLSGGGCLRWYRDTFCSAAKRDADELGMSVYQLMDNRAADIPIGCDGLIFYPYLGGRVVPPSPDYNGAWLGIKWSHRSEHFYRSILEAVAYEYKRYLMTLARCSGAEQFEEIRVFGGGASSSLWNQMKADVLGVPYALLAQQECSLLGSALIAASAIGAHKDLVQASETTNAISARFQPNLENTAVYDQKYRTYLGLLEQHESVLRAVLSLQ